jgi:flagellar hook-basal body complex protein FliE
LLQVEKLRENHGKLFSQKEEAEAAHRVNVQKLREKEKANEREMKRVREEHRTFKDHVMNLKDQIEELQEQAHDASETIIIKESEVRD